MTKKRYIYAVIVGILWSAAIYFVGFFAMNIFWKCSVKNPKLPGFNDYLAAFYGDRICLPLLVGLSVVFTKTHNKREKEQRIISLLIGLFFSLLGMVEQVKWLIRDTTKLNWTIPVQHHFNAAGWYHAVFFVFIFFVVSYLFSEMWFCRHGTSIGRMD